YDLHDARGLRRRRLAAGLRHASAALVGHVILHVDALHARDLAHGARLGGPAQRLGVLEAPAHLDHAVAQIAGLGVQVLRAQHFADVGGDLVARTQVKRRINAQLPDLADTRLDAVAHLAVGHRAAEHERAV